MKKIVFVLFICVFAFSSCALDLPFDSKDYRSGDAVIDERVHDVSIHWTSGEVNVVPTDSSCIEIIETSSKPLSSFQRVCWNVRRGCLDIRYCKSGAFCWLFNNPKTLTVKIPRTMLAKLSVEITSGSMKIEGVESSVYDLESTSGTVDCRVGNADSINVKSTSGSTNLTAGVVKNVKVKVTSGTMALDLEGADSIKVDSTSARVKIYLPESCGFRAKVKKTSGSFSCELPVSMDGDRYICGDGHIQMELETTSGSLRICKD